jgi:hypothetical protein
MSRHPRSPLRPLSLGREAGFALIATLTLLVLLTIAVVALMSTLSVERATARAHDVRSNAQLAVESGLEAAKQALSGGPARDSSGQPVLDSSGRSILNTQNDSFTVASFSLPSGSSDIPYFYVGTRAGSATTIQYQPLFSGGAMPASVSVTSSIVPALTPGAVPATDPNGQLKYPKLYSWQPPVNTAWVELHNAAQTAPNPATPTLRYAFWIEDLAGYLDAGVAGNSYGPATNDLPPVSTHSRDPLVFSNPAIVGADPAPGAQLALFTLFDRTNHVDRTKEDNGIIANRSLVFTGSNAKQLVSSTVDPTILDRNLAGPLFPDSEQKAIPFGLGYADAGRPKLDLNDQRNSLGVNTIANHLQRNLPNFARLRRGGFPSDLGYLRTLAANMIDYADIDSDATVGADYRGLDSYPLVSELYNSKLWTNVYTNPATGTKFVTIQMKTWIELWNMTNRTISGTVGFISQENHPVLVGFNSYTFGTTPADLPNNSSVAITPTGPIPVTMQPNEFKIVNVQNCTFELNSGLPAAGFIASPLSLRASLETNYQLTWNGTVVDRSFGRISRKSKTLAYSSSAKASDQKWSGTLPGFEYTESLDETGAFSDCMGDPRSASYQAAQQAANDYADNSSMGGRNRRWSINQAKVYYEVMPASWPDGGHQSTPAPTAGSVSRSPPTTPPVVNEPTKAPVFISNAGSYNSIAELGNIFDPAQWKYDPIGTPPNHKWVAIPSSATPDSRYGGGIHLRIGRTEFSKFDQDGARAWQLMDVLSAGKRTNTAGLVNINTATRETLRALGAGLLLNKDPDILPASLQNALYPPKSSATADEADLLAAAIIANRPYVSTSQLSNIRAAPLSSGASFFGNEARWPTNAPAEWNNVAAKEYFSRIIDLTTVRSRNFRIFVTGQVVDHDRQGNVRGVLATASKVYHVFLKPERDAAGAMVSQRAVVTYECDL